MANPFSGMFRRRVDNIARLDEGTVEIFRQFGMQLQNTATGIAVNPDTAVTNVAVLACLIVRSEALMLMPAHVYEAVGRNREKRADHPVAQLIADAPNPLLSSEEFWRWKQITEDLRGNAYARIEWRGGQPIALWPMFGQEPQVLAGTPSNPTVMYRYHGDDFTAAGDYLPRDIMHFKGPLLSGDPYKAKSMIQQTRETIGLGIATEQFFARFLGQGNHFPMYLETDTVLTDEDMKALRAQMDKSAGILPAGVTRIFDRGLKVKQNPMSLKDADLSTQQRFLLEQVCRIFRVPLPMVQDLTHGTYTNSEQADLWLSKYTATPIAKSTEGVIRRKLFLPSERSRYYAKFNVNAMMRGDFATRTAGYSVLINCGVLSPNEARALEDWNPYEGGDEFRVPLNTEPAGSEPDALASALLQRSLAESRGEETKAIADIVAAHQPRALPAAARTPDPQLTVDALAPLLGDARERILARHEQNLERGRGIDASLEFAELVLAPIIDTARALGVHLDVEQVARQIIEPQEGQA